jgi:hypothetical protein
VPSATTPRGHHLFAAEAHTPKVQWTPEAIIADQRDARLLVAGIGGFWGGAALSGMGSILELPPLIWFGVAMAFALSACFLTLQGRSRDGSGLRAATSRSPTRWTSLQRVLI